MKKYFLGILTIIITVLSINVVKAEEKVKVYMLTKHGCYYCGVARENLEELKKENPDLFDFVEIEVFVDGENGTWKPVSEDLEKYWNAVYSYFGDSLGTGGTPTLIIGDYAVAAALPKEDLLVSINAAKGKENLAEKIAQDINVDLSQFGIAEVESNNYDGLIIVGILVVLVGGFAGLIYLGKK